MGVRKSHLPGLNMLSRFLAFSLPLVLCIGRSAPVPDQADPHHIIVIVLDCVGIEAIERYAVGNPPVYAETLAIDRLALEGVRFHNVWAMPTCSPTRASVLLGQYPFRHGIGRQISPGGMSLTADAANTLPGILKTATPPYATMASGKWHLSGDSVLLEETDASPEDLGFDWFEGEMFHVSGPYIDPLPTDGTSLWTKFVFDGVTVTEEGSDGVGYLIHQQVQDAIDFFAACQAADATQPVFVWLGIQAPFEIYQRPPSAYSQDGLLFPGNTQPGGLSLTNSDKFPCFVETFHAAPVIPTPVGDPNASLYNAKADELRSHIDVLYGN